MWLEWRQWVCWRDYGSENQCWCAADTREVPLLCLQYPARMQHQPATAVLKGLTVVSQHVVHVIKRSFLPIISTILCILYFSPLFARKVLSSLASLCTPAKGHCPLSLVWRCCPGAAHRLTHTFYSSLHLDHSKIVSQINGIIEQAQMFLLMNVEAESFNKMLVSIIQL